MFRQFLFLYGKLGRIEERRISRNNFLKKYIYMYFLIKINKEYQILAIYFFYTLYMFEESKKIHVFCNVKCV